MAIENKSFDSFEQLINRFDGFFDGKIDEIEEEILEVNKWPQNIKLGNTIRRRDQEIEWLNRLKDEMHRAQAYIHTSIRREQDEKI